jgi:hypothetical protein
MHFKLVFTKDVLFLNISGICNKNTHVYVLDEFLHEYLYLQL